MFSNIVDLFSRGAVAIAEQFIRGNASKPTFGEQMRSKFGDEYDVPKQTETDFISRIALASGKANEISQGLIPTQEGIQEWLGWPVPGQIIHTGLARLSMVDPSGGEEFVTHIPFSETYKDFLTYTDVLERIDKALETNMLEGLEFYAPDIDRIEQYLRMLEIRGMGRKVSADMYSVFLGVEV